MEAEAQLVDSDSPKTEDLWEFFLSVVVLQLQHSFMTTFNIFNPRRIKIESQNIVSNCCSFIVDWHRIIFERPRANSQSPCSKYRQH
jgi:hypothetical protein